ncbi:MAG: alpha-L-fucosidase, partial [Ruminococcaceae bacterium]|nr:alpha-L-fucosidase [Oscillospiraceae bacterium]
MAIPTPAPYIARFEKMGFGMFAHWGLYSQLGIGEWAYRIHQLDKAEYLKLMDTFTAEDFDADQFVLAAKNAGAKYITLTTRHHDGFSLYDTCGLNKYDAPHSAAKRDLVREYVDACNRHDIMPMFYHTTLDW